MDNKIDIKDTQNKLQIMAQGGDYLNYLAKKVEKITTAIHLVTNLFSSEEPLKNALRQKSICLLSDINCIRQDFDSTEAKPILNISRSISDIVSMLSVARYTGLMSEMNYFVLNAELKALVELGNSEKIGLHEVIFSEKFFVPAEKHHISGEVIRESGENFESAIKNLSHRYKGHAVGARSKNLKDTEFVKGNASKKRKYASQRKKNPDQRKIIDGRRITILAFLKDSRIANIKDISKIVKNCSEKTIQRELMSLMAEGFVKKEGDRRWSKYRYIG